MTAAPKLESEHLTPLSPLKPDVGFFDYFLTVVFGVCFFLLLVVWDIVQRIAFYSFGEKALHRVDRTLNSLILRFLGITGANFKTTNPFVFPNTDSYIVVSNHQSMFDICMIHELVWQHTPRFISKKELGKWIPGISFNLRSGGHPLINRSSGAEAVAEINKFSRRLGSENFAAIIFPEGTRARDGVLKKFKPSGFLSLLRNAPNAKVIVVAIDGSWRFQTCNCWPVPRNSAVKIEVVEVLERGELPPEEIISKAEGLIDAKLKSWR